MVDSEARRQLALRLRRLASGRITNSEYEVPWIHRAPDEALPACFLAGWSVYSDLRSYRLRGEHALTPVTRAAIARCVLFLYSDLPYEWPPQRPLLIGLLLGIVTFGAWRNTGRTAWERSGDLGVWPFISYSDYQAALRRPPYLAPDASAA